MFNYDEMCRRIVRRYRRYDGYNGKTLAVGLAYCDGMAIEVAPCGYYRANAYKYADEAEMLYYFDHHPKVHFPQAQQNLSSTRLLTNRELADLPTDWLNPTVDTNKYYQSVVMAWEVDEGTFERWKAQGKLCQEHNGHFYIA